jgi:hypothetical protein
MADKSNCLSYVKRTVDIYFSGDTVCCARCPLLETYARKQCRKTGEYIVDDRAVGGWCPLVNPDTGALDGAYYAIN